MSKDGVVITRRAVAEDYEAVISMCYMDSGFDYLPEKYSYFISHPNFYSYVMVEELKIIGYCNARVVDNGTTVVLGGLRIEPNHRYKQLLWGNMGAFLFPDIRKSEPEVQRFIYISDYDQAQRKLIQHGQNRLIMTRNVSDLRTTGNHLTHVTSSPEFRRSLDDYEAGKVSTPAVEEFDHMLSDAAMKQLFPDDHILVFTHGYRAIKSNLAQIFQLSSVYVTRSATDANETEGVQALTYITKSQCPAGLRIHLDFYGDKIEYLMQHFLKFLLTIQTSQHEDMDFVLVYPTYLDKEAFDAFVKNVCNFSKGQCCDYSQFILGELIDFEHKASTLAKKASF